MRDRDRAHPSAPPWPLAFAVTAFFTAVSAYLIASGPAVVSVLSLGFGYAVGWALLLAPQVRYRVALGYALIVATAAALSGRSTAAGLTTAIGLALSVLILALLGDRLHLRRLTTPADALKLMVLAAASSVLMVALTVFAAYAARLGDQLYQYLPQTALTGIAGILLTGTLILSYEPGAYAVRGTHRQLELLALTAATVALLIVNSAITPETIIGASPLFLLVMTMGWLALRFGPAIASLGVVSVSISIAIEIFWGEGAFVSASSNSMNAVAATQIYIAVLAGGVLMLALYARHTREQDAAALRSAELLSSAADGAEAQVFVKHYNPSTNRFAYVEVNDNFAAALDKTPADVIGLSDEDLHTPEAARQFHHQDSEVMRSGLRQRYYTHTTVNGRPVTFLASKFPLYDSEGTAIGVGGVSLDRTEERRREALLQLAFARSPVPTARVAWSARGMGEILEANDAFADLVALPGQSIVGKHMTEILYGQADHLTPGDAAMVRREVRLRRHDAVELTLVATVTVVGDGGAEEPFALVIFEDVTAARAAEAGLVHRATHDPLTDLLNRRALVERLSARVSGPVPAGTAVWCCDLDGFKHFNDRLGHDAGDRVLLAMADRMRAIVEVGSILGRLGADEFVIVSGSEVEREAALQIGQEIRECVAQPLEMDGRTHSIRVSVGLAIADGESGAEELLRQADVALTRAKDLGRDRVEAYLPELDRRVQLREAMRETLRKALAENRVEVHAQPVVDLDSGRIVGAEALVRLRDLDDTMLQPAGFIPVAEETGLIIPLGLRVLDLALALCARWAEKGTPLEIAVNVSPKQLADADFAGTVSTLLQVHQVPPERLVLEVTESTVVDATGPTLEILTKLRGSGVHIAIDDFGTGYSSLASLRELPADIVKIDRSFVAGLGRDPGDEAIVRAVLAMSHATDRIVVAEGVETAAQAQRLAELNCDRVQGFYFSVPVAPFDFVPGHVYQVSAPATDPRGSDRPARP